MKRLKKKVALITGAARGIGLAISQRFAQEGAHVILTDIAESVDDIAKQIGGSATAYVHDVSDRKRWDEIVTDVIDDAGPIDILVNNAGRLLFKSFMDTSEADFREIHSVNVMGVFHGIQTVAPGMMERGEGAIINISSIDGIEGANGLGAYSSSKFAMRGLTRVAALELAPLGIRVNSIHPGGINTRMGNPLGAPEESVNQAYRQFPAQTIGKPEHVAAACAYLASDDAGYCFGTELVVDGGILAGHYYFGMPGSPEGMLGPMPEDRSGWPARQGSASMYCMSPRRRKYQSSPPIRTLRRWR